MIRPGETRRETLPILAGFRVASPGFWPPRIGAAALGRTARSGVSCETGEWTWNFPAGPDRAGVPALGIHTFSSDPANALPENRSRSSDQSPTRATLSSPLGFLFQPTSTGTFHESLMLIVNMRSRFVQDQIANFSTCGGKFLNSNANSQSDVQPHDFLREMWLVTRAASRDARRAASRRVFPAEVMATAEKDFEYCLLFVLYAWAVPCTRGLDSRDARSPSSPKFVSRHGLRNSPAVVERCSWCAGLCRIASEGGRA